MRVVVCIVILFLSLNPEQGHAQKYDSINKTFIRIYDLNDKKIGAGRIAFINDSVVALKKSEVYHSYFLKDIGKIKTKRSGGNNILKGALIGAGVGLVHGLVNRESDDVCDDCLFSFGYSKGFYVMADMLAGAQIGVAVGGITAIIKNGETFIINGDLKRWEMFKEFVVH